ncbi:hypothetical protein D7Y11_31175 [Corallococcus sp. AB018]|uniref:hypothetical protein n=1 Tax=Corallococcus sp. AB018 TaxID=2316715 RepID=UPI000F895AC1|nr:hypothetical protein [Corallococcus sp. AB018]RUO89275.1 hypothetical protein D7Y11_31175 [Corallococcus sp. AB018]
MPEQIHTVDDVFGVSRDLPLNYVTRESVDTKLMDNLSRSSHVVIYGTSKQGKTSLRKHCLKDTDYVVVSCQNRWNLAETHASILKECGYTVRQSSSKTVSGSHKITANFEGKGGIPLIAEAKGGGGYEHLKTQSATESRAPIELDPGDVNDIVRALNEINFNKFIVLEDFHYLPDETQRDMAFSLKAFHEKSKITFIIVGVWREENRLIAYNGDLTDRVFAVDVDDWTATSLKEVVRAGEQLLNVQFADLFIEGLLRGCFESVHIVQEVCRRCLRAERIFETQATLREVGGSTDVARLIKQVVDEQGGRYNGFIMNFADGFQQTDLEMPRWIMYVLLKSSVDQLRDGLRLREISRLIKSAHPKGEDLNNGNITQALVSASSLQLKKNIRPIIVDYDTTNRNLQVVDKSFLIWIASQDRDELLSDLGLSVTEEKD